jgi:hypothetical protein
MKVEILPTHDCANCVVEKIFDEMKIPYEIINVTKKPECLVKYPIYTASGIVINGKHKFTGMSKKEKLVEKLR